jgi:hypothetical protein
MTLSQNPTIPLDFDASAELSATDAEAVRSEIEAILREQVGGDSGHLSGVELIAACEAWLREAPAATRRDFLKGFLPLYRQLLPRSTV